MKIKAAVIHNANDPFKIEEVDLAMPKANDVLIKIVACGVCHTDEIVRTQGIPSPLPIVLGHEGAGIVEEVGENVTGLKKGDRVCLSYASCGHCENCLDSAPYACEDLSLYNFGGVLRDGTKRLSQDGQEVSTFFGQSSFATYAVAHESNVVKIEDDSIDLALVAPLGCGFQTGAGTVLNRLKPKFGSSIAVFGLGSVGFSALMAAKIAGCETIIAVGGTPSTLELALELGATHAINHRTENVEETIINITKGGVNYAIDTSGVSDIINTALASLRYRGTVVMLAAAPKTDIDVHHHLMSKSASLTGVIEGEAISKLFIPKLISYYKKGLFPIDKLISTYDFSEINQAFEDSHKKKVIKAVLKMD